MRISVFLLLSLGVCFGCRSAADRRDYAKELVGSWLAESLHIAIKTLNNSDTLKNVSVGPNQWESKMGMKPMLTIFKEDGSYYSERRDRAGLLATLPAGSWSVAGDSLFLTQKIPLENSFRYHLTLSGDMLELHSMIDSDGDGGFDDTFYTRMKRPGDE